MELKASRIAELIFHLIYNNIASHDEGTIARAVNNRFTGFRSELEFVKLCRDNNRTILSGGCFLPLRSGQPTLEAPLYFTFDFESPDHYLNLYREIAKMPLSKLVYVNADEEAGWKETPLYGMTFPVPGFRCFDFQNNGFRDTSGFAPGLSYLTGHYTPRQPFVQQITADPALIKRCCDLISGYPSRDLLGLYLTRLIFDGFIGFSHYRGIPSDIDCVVVDSRGRLRLYEVKEKDLSKTKPVGFGIDVQRYHDCLGISLKTGLPYYYMVRHVDNQQERNFIGWKYISFAEFDAKMDPGDIKNGRTGMNTAGDGNNPTFMLGREFFHELKI